MPGLQRRFDDRAPPGLAPATGQPEPVAVHADTHGEQVDAVDGVTPRAVRSPPPPDG
ncbi:MAG TPA: hypothetical protein VIJ23_08305 [Mycobacterium sp.]